jgi:RNA polymerase sigma factor (sigma-70 family)
MAGLIEAVPRLQAFALSLIYNMDRAEDLVQETILKAWNKRGSFESGTNLNAWLFTILRNQLYTEHRKRVREVEDIDGNYAAASPSYLSKLTDWRCRISQVHWTSCARINARPFF